MKNSNQNMISNAFSCGKNGFKDVAIVCVAFFALYGCGNSEEAVLNAEHELNTNIAATSTSTIESVDAASVSASESPASAPVESKVRVLEPDVTSSVIYISSSEGHDFNDGLTVSTPIATIAQAGKLLKDHEYDFVLLKRGDRFNESFAPVLTKRAGSDPSLQPLVISTYGDDSHNPTIIAVSDDLRKDENKEVVASL